MKKLASTAAAMAFSASAALAQEGIATSENPMVPVWQSKNFKILSPKESGGLANTFILACPVPEMNLHNIKLYLYNNSRADLAAMAEYAREEVLTNAEESLMEAYPPGYSDGMVNPDGSIIPAYNAGQYADILTRAYTRPGALVYAPVGQENVLQNIRSFAINFCYGVS